MQTPATLPREPTLTARIIGEKIRLLLVGKGNMVRIVDVGEIADALSDGGKVSRL